MASWENPIGKVTAARQKNITEKRDCGNKNLMPLEHYVPATKPTHFAYGVTVRSQSVAMRRTIVVVTQMQPQKTQTRVICGGKVAPINV